MKYRIWVNKNKTESHITGKGGHQYSDATDVNGKPMKMVKEFSAATHNQAMQIYNDYFGYGKYIPMKE